MTSRNAPLLAERLEQSSDTAEAAPHRAKQETVSHDKQEETLQTAVNAAKKGFLLNRNFAWLASGQTISNLGDFVFSTTLLIWVFTLTHSPVAVSGVLAAQYIPVFLLGPLAGVFVDRWNRRQTMLISDLIRAVTATLPLIAPASLRLQAIYASVFLISALGRFFLPAESGIMQVIVAPSQQRQAASIKQAIFAFSIILGPALASPLYFAVGPVLAIL
jgi:MFS family permease